MIFFSRLYVYCSALKMSKKLYEKKLCYKLRRILWWAGLITPTKESQVMCNVAFYLVIYSSDSLNTGISFPLVGHPRLTPKVTVYCKWKAMRNIPGWQTHWFWSMKSGQTRLPGTRSPKEANCRWWIGPLHPAIVVYNAELARKEPKDYCPRLWDAECQSMA